MTKPPDSAQLVTSQVAVLLAASPRSNSMLDAFNFVRLQTGQGGRVSLYLYDKAVQYADGPEVTEAVQLGVAVYACFESCRRERIAVRSSSVIMSGLVTLAGLIEASDVFEAFT